MTRAFTDKWGEEALAIDPRDWAHWPLWAEFSDAYEWVDGEDYLEQDVIVWRESVMVDRNARSGKKSKPDWVKVGERLVIAHVRSVEGRGPEWVYLVVIHSTGDRPLLRDAKIKRRPRNIVRNGVRRWPRDRNACLWVSNRPPGQEPEIPLNVRNEVEERAARLGVQSRFLGNHEPKP